MLLVLPALRPAAAHPHVWVEIDSEIIVEGRSITGVRHRWTFDEAYSEQAVEGLDANKDGRIDRDELAELTKINMEALPQFGYFTEIGAPGVRVAVKTPGDSWLEQVTLPPAQDDLEKRPRKALVLHFTLPLAEPLPLQPTGLSFAVRDPSFFIAFLTAGKSAVRFSKGAAVSCVLSADREAQALSTLAQAMQDALAKAGEQPAPQPPPGASGPNFNQVYSITCR
ncbi:MAG: DUF1007 family protein [Hyphomicrobiaceae bacterium]